MQDPHPQSLLYQSLQRPFRHVLAACVQHFSLQLAAARWRPPRRFAGWRLRLRLGGPDGRGEWVGLDHPGGQIRLVWTFYYWCNYERILQQNFLAQHWPDWARDCGAHTGTNTGRISNAGKLGMGRGQSPHLAPCGTSKQGSWEDAIWGGVRGHTHSATRRGGGQDHPHRITHTGRTVGEQNVLKGRRAAESERKKENRQPKGGMGGHAAESHANSLIAKILLAALKRRGGGWPSAALHALLVRSVRRSALGHHRSTLRSPPAAQSPTRPPDGRR